MFDEAHVYLTQTDFRPLLEKICRLSGTTCAKILLSGTIPPKLEKNLLNTVGLAPSTKIIREPCVQYKAKFHCVKKPTDAQPVQMCVKLMTLLQAAVFQKGSRGVVFCTSKKSVEQVAKETGCGTYASGQARENEVNMEKWQRGQHQWMAATPGLIAGIDLPYVDVIIFLEHPYGLIDFVQGAGRGGRAGRPYYVVVIDTLDDWRDKVADPLAEAKCSAEMKQWCRDTTECHRKLIGNVMDGQGRTCRTLPGAELCEQCKPDDVVTRLIHGWQYAELPDQCLVPIFPSQSLGKRKEMDDQDLAMPSAKRLEVADKLGQRAAGTGTRSMLTSALRRGEESSKEEMVKQLEDALVAVKGICPGCWIMRNLRRDSANNALCISCSHTVNSILEKNHEGSFVSWKSQKINYPRKYSYCFRCDVPQDPYSLPSHPSSIYKQKSQPHLFQDVISVGWILVFGRQNIWHDACKAFASLQLHESMTLQQFSLWLVEEQSALHFSNGIYLFLWLCKQHN